MRYLFFLLFCFPLCCEAQESLSSLAGKWNEQIRLNKKEIPSDFADTLRIEIQRAGMMMVRYGESSFSDEAKLSNNNLLCGKYRFSVKAFVEDTLWIKDRQGIHVMCKQKDRQLAVIPKRIPGVETGQRQLDWLHVQGKWTCYKKTDPDFKTQMFYLQHIKFQEEREIDGYRAQVTYTNFDSVYTAPAMISMKGYVMHIQTEKINESLSILKCVDDEMILEKGSVHYFLKKPLVYSAN